MSEEADIVTIVSSDLIATVMEDYFNKKMYKIPVHIVELKPTEAGYSFFLQFTQKEISKPLNIKSYPNGQSVELNTNLNRGSKGRFVKKVTN